MDFKNFTFQDLKTICWGGPNIVPGPEWVKTGIIFHEPEKLYAFGLQALKGAPKGFQMVLQAYILKHLLFAGKSKYNARQDKYNLKLYELIFKGDMLLKITLVD